MDFLSNDKIMKRDYFMFSFFLSTFPTPLIDMYALEQKMLVVEGV